VDVSRLILCSVKKVSCEEASRPPRRASDGSLEVLLWICRRVVIVVIVVVVVVIVVVVVVVVVVIVVRRQSWKSPEPVVLS
jgi:heme/copper-type cytochrome/quinol oxidase subunit 2